MAAPQIPRLVEEGFPAARWPASGWFAEIAGRPEASPFPTTGRPNAWSRRLLAERHGRALLVFQGGEVRLAHYAAGTDANTRFNAYSMVKSLVGALLLKAVAEGRITSLDIPIGDVLPNVGDAALQRVPLRDFADMRSGVAIEADPVKALAGPVAKDIESYRLNPFGAMARLHMGGLAAVDGELTAPPARRGRYNYQNANTALLGAVLERVYGQPLQRLLAEKIWQPAGAAPARWRRYGKGLPVSPYCCVYATASDWLRVGVFLMRNGPPSAPFLPRPLWRQLFAAGPTVGYRLHLFHNILDRPGEPLQGRFTYMFGRGGQTVYLMPEQDLVVVRFGDALPFLHSTLYAVWRSI